MGREVSTVYRLEGRLVVDGEMSIGSGRDAADADIQVIRDGLGRLIIPGESLAGVLLRTPGIQRWDTTEQASPIWVEDAVAEDSAAAAATEVRDHGNRDRRWGSAADKGLFSREAVQHGTSFSFRIDVEAHPGPGGNAAASTAAAVAAALGRGIAVGGRRSAGSGRLVWAKPTITTLPVGQAAGLIAALLGSSDTVASDVRALLPALVTQSLTDFQRAHQLEPAGPDKETLTITIPFRPVSPLLTSVATEGVARMVPALELRSDGWHARVQFRQGLRVLSERIERTLLGGPPAEVGGESGHSTQFEADLLDRRCKLTTVIFGSQGGRTTGRAAAWTQAPVTSRTRVATTKEWSAVLRAVQAAVPPTKDGDIEKDNRAQHKLTVGLRQALAPTRLRLQEHIQIEAWSGAPLDGHLYGLIAVEPDVPWEDAQITVDLRRLATVHKPTTKDEKVMWESTESPDQLMAALALIVLVLREAAAGELGLGYGTSRGLGEIRIDPARVTFSTESTGPASVLHATSLADILADDALAEFQQAWTTHLMAKGVTA